MQELSNFVSSPAKPEVYSKEINQVYGNYVGDLEDDIDDIIRYFEKDFLIKPGKKNIPITDFWEQFWGQLRFYPDNPLNLCCFFGAGNEIRKRPDKA